MLDPADYVESGSKWFAPNLTRKELKTFLTRNNHRGFAHFGLWLALLGGLGYLAARLYLVGSWWAIPSFLIYGVVYSSNNARWHECSHGTCFRSDWANRFFYWLCGSMELRDGIEFRWSHARHHSYTMIRTIDPAIPLPRPPNLIKYAMDYFYLWSGFYALRNLILHAVGVVPGMVRNYVPEDEFKVMFWSARAALLPHVLVILLSILTASWLPVLLFGPTAVLRVRRPMGIQRSSARRDEGECLRPPDQYAILPSEPCHEFPLCQYGTPHRAPSLPPGSLASATETP
jgi:fatty acid desaturase